MLFEGIEEKQTFYPLLGETLYSLELSNRRSITNYLIANKILLNVFIIGCGGTGGYLVPNISRLLSVKTSPYIKSKLILIDGDEVK